MGGRITQIQKNNSIGLIYCSTNCASIFNRLLNPNVNIGKTITENQIENIRSLKRQGFSSYKISEKLGIARNTVVKYRSDAVRLQALGS